MAKKLPRIMVVIDSGKIWEVCADIEMVVIVKNLDQQTIRKITPTIGENGLEEAEYIINALNQKPIQQEKERALIKKSKSEIKKIKGK